MVRIFSFFYSFVPKERKNEESAIAEVNTSILWTALIYNSTFLADKTFTAFFRQRRKKERYPENPVDHVLEK